MIQVLYVTAECAPFIKAGGLGDVASSLPAALTGCNVHVVLPYYSCLDAEQAELSFFASLTLRAAAAGCGCIAENGRVFSTISCRRRTTSPARNLMMAIVGLKQGGSRFLPVH